MKMEKKMKMNKFKIYLEYDPEYEGFIADVPMLPGCMSQGKTEKEVLKNIQEAISCPVLWDIKNGRTLCRECHKRTKTYGVNKE